MVGKGLHHTSLHTLIHTTSSQHQGIFSFCHFLSVSCKTLGVNGSLRLLLVSMWLLRATAVLSDLQCAQSECLMGCQAFRLPTRDLC